jgi:hypothetical protein
MEYLPIQAREKPSGGDGLGTLLVLEIDIRLDDCVAVQIDEGVGGCRPAPSRHVVPLEVGHERVENQASGRRILVEYGVRSTKFTSRRWFGSGHI